MKKFLVITIGAVFATATVRADIAAYQTVVNSQNPAYYFNFDDSLTANVGSGTFGTAGSSTGFTTDLSGNANDALHVGNSTSGYTLTTPNIINNAGSSTAVGSFSFLFNLASAGGTQYFFSDSENTGTAPGSALALDFSGTLGFQFKVGNHSFVSATYLPAPVANTWYYFAANWNFDGVPADDTVNWWIGSVGGSLVAGNNTLVPYSSWAAGTTVGAGGTFDLGARSTLASSSTGSYDELATWSSQLTSDQVNAQFNALTPAPEPSSCAMLGLGGLLVLWKRRAFRRD